MSKFYTGKGDDGTTGYLGKGRISKDDLRMETLGTLDECSAQLGVVRCLVEENSERELVKEIQRCLFQIMGEVAADVENAEKYRSIDAAKVSWLDEQVSKWSEGLETPGEFILPGDTLPGAEYSLARTMVRRAERRVVQMARGGMLCNPALLKFMNRLSTLLYLLEIRAARKAGVTLSLTKEK